MSKSRTADHSLKALKAALLQVIQSHPSRNFNHKQVGKLLRQHDPVLYARHFSIEDASGTRNTMLRLLSEMVLSGELIEQETGRYRATPTKKYVEGTIDITASGAAYVINENFDKDIYIAPGKTLNALNGDTVKILLSASKGKRQEGEVVEVTERVKNEFVGILQVQQKFAFLVPDSHKSTVDLFIPLSNLNGARHGQKVIGRITEWEPGTKNPTGEVIQVLGNPGENSTEMHAILAEYGFPVSFPDEVEAEAKAIPFEIPASEIKRRRDMRKVITLTIDPVDAKDFDDALSVQIAPDGTYEIGIHIADVSYYLKPGMAMDDEAFERATSVYLVDRVVPMLPEKLSNNVCSLRPNEDKLCYSAIIRLNGDAEVLEEWYGRTVIHSDKRFTYEEAQQVIETGKGPLAKEILLLDKLAKKMRAARFKKGAITFEKVEIKFLLDEKGNPTGVYTKENKDSNKLIEEFMLLANRKVAEFIGKHGGVLQGKNKKSGTKKSPTFVYRIHDSPVSDRLENFSAFASKFGYRINTKTDKDIAQSLNQLMRDVRGKKEQNVLEQLAIRTMSKAVYTTENIGHYGLAMDYYTHFTSPIRRYPDVLVHRLLDHYMKGGKPVNANDYEEMCQHATDMEIKASEAERASIKYKQVQFLQDKHGVVFEGLISGVTEWGFYVEIIENKCEGLVRLRDIGSDFYELDEENYCIRGHRSGKVYRLGDEVSVVIKNTDLVKKQIDFLLYGEEPDNGNDVNRPRHKEKSGRGHEGNRGGKQARGKKPPEKKHRKKRY